MTDNEAVKVIGLLKIGFPNARFNDDATVLFWTEELRPFGFQRAVEAARATVRNHEFLSLHAFFSELDRVNAKPPEAGPWPGLPRPTEDYEVASPEATRSWVNQIRTEVFPRMRGPLAGSLRRTVAPMPTPNQAYFEPSEQDQEEHHHYEQGGGRQGDGAPG